MKIEINLLKTAEMIAQRELLMLVCMEHTISEDDAFNLIYEDIDGKSVFKDSYYDSYLDIYNSYYDVLLRMSVDESQIEEQNAESTTSESEDSWRDEKLDDAMDKVTANFNGITYGEEIDLNDKYCLYHYTEDDIVTINRTKDDEGNDDWAEVLQVMSDGENLTFEML